MLVYLLFLIGCSSETTEPSAASTEPTAAEPTKYVAPKAVSADWKMEFEKRKGDYGYAMPNFEEFKGQIEDCKKLFGDTASVACVADCSVLSLEREAYNIDHIENAQPINPQIVDQLGNDVCKPKK